jgi:hypothetical protein
MIAGYARRIAQAVNAEFAAFATALLWHIAPGYYGAAPIASRTALQTL